MENDSLRQAKFDTSPRARAARKHRESFWINSGKGDFRAVIDYLVPPPASPASLVALFDSRATYGAIQHWRYRGSAPAWAIDLACEKLHARLNTAYQILARAPQWVGAPERRGAAGAKALAAWRERKAREKEKAAHEAALQHETKNSV